VRHTVIRTITTRLREDAPVSWQGCDFDFTGVRFDGGDFTHAHFTAGTVTFRGAEFTGGTVDFTGAEFTGGTVDFTGAQFTGATVNFSRAEFTGATVNFTYAGFSAGTVNFTYARFSAGTVGFHRARFTGGRVDFAGPPPATGACPVGLREAAAEAVAGAVALPRGSGPPLRPRTDHRSASGVAGRGLGPGGYPRARRPGPRLPVRGPAGKRTPPLGWGAACGVPMRATTCAIR